MSIARRLLISGALLALPLATAGTVVTATPAAAGPDLVSTRVAPSSSGGERMCLGVDDLDGANTTWVCSPEAQWYGAVVSMLLAMTPG